MSSYLNFDTKLRSYSPHYQTFDSSNASEKHKEFIHNHINLLPDSPGSKMKMEQTFNEMLNSVHFFRKPDIIPFPFLNLDRPVEDPPAPLDTRYKDLIEELERERNLRKAAERENETLKERLTYLADIESKYEEYRLKSINLHELNSDIDKLNSKIRVLQEENEELRRKLRSGYESSTNSNKLLKELEKEKENCADVTRQLNELQKAYEDLRRVYAKDISAQQERYEVLYDEKIQLELRLREVRDRVEKLQDPYDPEIQARISNIKHKYKDKFKNTEKSVDTEYLSETSKGRLKEIEDRLADLQGKLSDQNARSRRGPGSQTSRGSTPKKERNSTSKGRNSPQGTCKRGSGLSPYSLQKSGKFSASSGYEFKPDSPKMNKSPGRGAASAKSNLRNSHISPSTDGHRVNEKQHECKTCVRRHGHEWAKSPGRN